MQSNLTRDYKHETCNILGKENLTEVKDRYVRQLFNNGNVPAPNSRMVPGRLTIRASGDKIDMAVKLALFLRNEVKLHMITQPCVHLPRPGAAVNNQSRVTTTAAMRQYPNLTCEERFDELMSHKIVAGITILLSQDKISQDEIGYQRPEPPLKAMKQKVSNNSKFTYKNKENNYYGDNGLQRNHKGEISGYNKYDQKPKKNPTTYDKNKFDDPFALGLAQNQQSQSSSTANKSTKEKKHQQKSENLDKSADCGKSFDNAIDMIDRLQISKNSSSLMNNSEPIDNNRSSSMASGSSQIAKRSSENNTTRKHVSFSDGHTSEASHDEHIMIEKRIDESFVEEKDQDDFIISNL